MRSLPLHSRRGSSLLELALCLTLLWLLFSGIYQYGFTIYTYNQLGVAVAGGAGYASRVEFDSPANSFVSKVKNMVVYGNPQGGSFPLVAGLTPAKVSVTWTTDGAGIPRTITVAITGFTIDALFAQFLLTNKPSITVRHMGLFKT
jgi:Flp pilus assembly protein TadG